MNIFEISALLIAGSAVFVAVPLGFGFWKKSLITHTVVANRQTDDGESLTLQAGFTALTPHYKLKDSIFDLMSFGDERKWFTDDRFKERLAQEIAANEKKTKLSSV